MKALPTGAECTEVAEPSLYLKRSNPDNSSEDETTTPPDFARIAAGREEPLLRCSDNRELGFVWHGQSTRVEAVTE